VNKEEAIVANETAPVTTYHEKKIGKTLYRVTSVYKGEIDFAKTLEDLIVRKILTQENFALAGGD
jgi:hypothetical protein